ncbi:MAG: glycosyltransferase family 9 protein [Acidiferrobacter sp.]
MEAGTAGSRLLMVCPGNIGDVIRVGPALRSLRRAFPQATITLMVSLAGATVAAQLPGVDEVFVHRAGWQDGHATIAWDPVHGQALIAAIRDRGFDSAWFFTGPAQTSYGGALMAYLAGIPVRVGPSPAPGGGLLTHRLPPPPMGVPQVERNLHLLKAVGVAVGSAHLELAVPPAADARVVALLRDRGIPSRFVVLAPGATYGARRYALPRYAVVAAALRRRGYAVVVVGGRGDIPCGDALVAAAPGSHSLCGHTELAELTALMRRATLLITNDSGLVPIGDAMNCPMVVLQAGTEPRGPETPRAAPVRWLQQPTACAPCYQCQCPYGQECLDIPPAEVAARALELIAKSGTEERADG